MILCLDAGNSRLKWAIYRAGQRCGEGVLAHAEVGELASLGRVWPQPAQLWLANVAGPALAAAIGTSLAQAWPGAELRWVCSQAQAAGVSNGYGQPERLGVDRWCALIAAWERVRGACLVVMAGTATTIDSLDATGHFPGGLILPGLELMRRSLARDTAALPLANGRYASNPKATDDAIISGCLEAQAGAIERAWRRLDDPAAPCLLSGGAAPAIGPLLSIPWQGVENLVLDGVYRLALAER